MTRTHRAMMALLTGALVSGAAQQARAQIQGMPLFTNPNFGTGIRVHADIGQPTNAGSQPGSLTVIQGGATLAFGPIGIDVNAGVPKDNIKNAQQCASGLITNCDVSQTKFTGSALVQLHLMGGGINPLSLSLFGGASTDFSAYDLAKYSYHPTTAAESLAVQQFQDSIGTKELTIPLGAAVGVHIPLLFTSLNVWGAPRFELHKFSNCSSSNATLCSKTTSAFRWAIGVDVPLFSIISIRGAYDSGKVGDQTVNNWGVGVSIGLGGMR